MRDQRSKLEDRIRHQVPHLSDEEAQTLAGLVERLVDIYEPEQVYLFGSKARGDAGPDSDYDLMVVVPDDAPPERLQSRLANDVLWEAATAADVIIWQSSRFQRRSRVVCSLPATVLREGRLLYAA